MFALTFSPKKVRWTERDLNPRPPPCEGGDLPLIYQPLLGQRIKKKEYLIVSFDFFYLTEIS
jgi:hypothetical protein